MEDPQNILEDLHSCLVQSFDKRNTDTDKLTFLAIHQGFVIQYFSVKILHYAVVQLMNRYVKYLYK